MAELRWLRRAVDDLDVITDRVAEENPAAAYRLLGRIRQAALRLQTFPQSGLRSHSAKNGYYLIVRPCVIAYTFDGHFVTIARIYHQRQEWH